MAKSKEQVVKDNVEAAIRSLYNVFESPSYRGCSNTRTKETVALEKRIQKRKSELSKDPELKKLEADLDEVRKIKHKQAGELRSEVEKLLRQFQLRGVSDELIAEIEKLAAKEPILLKDECC